MALVQAAPGTVLITGTTSGVGLYATKSLVERGWRVITANRSSLRAEASASAIGLPINSPRQLKHIQIDLGDLDSVRNGAKSLLEDLEKPLDALVCNAAEKVLKLRVSRWAYGRSWQYRGRVKSVHVLNSTDGWSGTPTFTISGADIGGVTPGNDVKFGTNTDESAADGPTFKRYRRLGY